MSLRLTYYPGCTAHGTGRELDESLEAVCAKLDIGLTELKDWSCCGASSAHGAGQYLEVALPARNLALSQAQAKGQNIGVTCSACFSRLRHALKHVRAHGTPEGLPAINTDFDVVNMTDVLTSPAVLDRLRTQAGEALKGLKVVCYYGCLLTRPLETTDAVRVEDPRQMETIFTAMGGTAIDWPYKTTCCGGSLALGRPDVVARLSADILGMAKRAGADLIATSCPMCFMNLDRKAWETQSNGGEAVPIFYFTELMLLGLDRARARAVWKRHLTDPTTILTARGLQ